MQEDDPHKPPPIPVIPLAYRQLPPGEKKSAGWQAFKIISYTLLIMVGIVVIGVGVFFGACMLLKR